MSTGITAEAFADAARLDAAFDWLCKRRKDWPAGADVWAFRRRWPQEKERLQRELLAGSYEADLLSRVTLWRDGEQTEVDLWPARDAVVMKALAGLLQEALPISPRVAHIADNGGLKGAVRQVWEALPEHAFVMKTDVKSYYASIDHSLLLERLARHIDDQRLMRLLVQYLRRTAEHGGLYREDGKGISLGCPLSPVIGAFYLAELDAELEHLGYFWVRFMDDILVLTPTRWKLRKAVRVVNQVLAKLKLAKHPDKTFIGRIGKGFDWLGYHVWPGGLRVADQTLDRFLSRVRQLYELESKEESFSVRLGVYVLHWMRWVYASLALDRVEISLQNDWQTFSSMKSFTYWMDLKLQCCYRLINLFSRFDCMTMYLSSN